VLNVQTTAIVCCIMISGQPRIATSTEEISRAGYITCSRR